MSEVALSSWQMKSRHWDPKVGWKSPVCRKRLLLCLLAWNNDSVKVCWQFGHKGLVCKICMEKKKEKKDQSGIYNPRPWFDQCLIHPVCVVAEVTVMTGRGLALCVVGPALTALWAWCLIIHVVGGGETDILFSSYLGIYCSTECNITVQKQDPNRTNLTIPPFSSVPPPHFSLLSQLHCSTASNLLQSLPVPLTTLLLREELLLWLLLYASATHPQ